MNSIRKYLGFLLAALALAAVSLPSSAAQPAKIFGLVMSPSTAASTSVSLQATYSNLTPNGNSVINTVILTPPVGSTNVAASFPQGGNQVTCPATTVNSSGQTVPVPDGSICVANIPSVMKAGCSPVACSWTMNVTATLPNSCGINTWAGQAFAGNSFNGDVFAFQAASSSVTTTINVGCTYTITTTANPTAGGLVSCSPNPVLYGGSSTCTATATNPGWTFTGFSGDCSGMACSLSNVTSNKSVTANFKQWALSIISSPTSAAVGVGNTFDVVIGNDPAGASVTVDATACPGATWTSTTTGSPVTSTTFTFTVPTMPASGVCGLTFNATNYVSVSMSPIKVYKGTIGCYDYDSVNGPSDLSYDPDGFTVPPSTTDTKLDAGYIGTPGWGLRRGPNKDGAACYKVNYSCDMDTTVDPAVVTCTWDKAFVPQQQATFKYLFLWPAKAPDASGYSSYRPQVSWPPAVPDTTTAKAYKFPTWAPLVACISDTFPALPTLPTTILPQIPNAAPFSTDPDNTLPQYQPTATAWVCGGQSGWTAVGAPSGPSLIQQWNIIIDEADLRVVGP